MENNDKAGELLEILTGMSREDYARHLSMCIQEQEEVKKGDNVDAGT